MDPLTALETSTRIAAGDVGILDIVDAALEAAHADECHAWTWIDDTGARNTARKLQRQLDAGQARPGPLFGVPCPVKDLNALAGAPRAVGSRAVGGTPSDHDDGIVTRLKAAGAIPIGTTAAPEFGLPCYTEPDGRAATVTPWDHTRMAGGSSGGAAAAVGAGQVPIAQGSDGGGSIRIPASCCGVVGLKPSRGRVSAGPYGIDGPGLVCGGVLTRTVRDTAAALDVLSGPWPGDPFYAPTPTETFLSACGRDPGRLRIGILREPVIADVQVHPDILAALDRTAATLESMGHVVEQTSAPFGPREWDSFRCVWEWGRRRYRSCPNVRSSSHPCLGGCGPGADVAAESSWPRRWPVSRWWPVKSGSIGGGSTSLLARPWLSLLCQLGLCGTMRIRRPILTPSVASHRGPACGISPGARR